MPQGRVWWVVAKQLWDCNWIAELHFILERCEGNISLSGWGLDFLILFQYRRYRTLAGKRNVTRFLILDFISVCTRRSFSRTMCFSRTCPSTLELPTAIIRFPLDLYTIQVYNKIGSAIKITKKKRKCFASTFLGVMLCHLIFFMTTMHFGTFRGLCGRGGGSDSNT